MELKPYQQTVIHNLSEYLQYLQVHGRTDVAFARYWEDKIGPYNPLEGTGMKPYQNTVPGAVHLCIKVPTAGGKTFIACNALHTIFSAYSSGRPRAVVWLVPWSNLLDQTIQALSDPQHPYRQKLNTLFGGRVEVYGKKDLLQGSNFNPVAIGGQLSIFVLSFASIRARRKEDRKIFEENGQLATFLQDSRLPQNPLPDTDGTALINVIRSLQPVVMLDESHNAESELSTDMLNDLAPSFILDLTATPKEKSNIVSYVPALELKQEHMVKLPVIVYNHHDKNEVIASALHLQHRLEALSRAETAEGGRFIRPIVLFQAQPRTREDAVDYRALKAKLLALGIDEAQIKIKTAEIDELKGIDLMAASCEVRYIITVNALKEGWDCPFAYILASLADKSSEVDVTQILGRVLRQPYVKQHRHYQLNLSYVLTASARFGQTLQKIVEGLQQAGFSRNDYRSEDSTAAREPPEPQAAASTPLFPQSSADEGGDDEIDPAKIGFAPAAMADLKPSESVSAIEALARDTSDAFDAEITALRSRPAETTFLTEIADKVKSYRMRPSLAAIAAAVSLPHFYVRIPDANPLFHEDEWQPLNTESLLKDFRLSKKDSDINWDALNAELYQVDLQEEGSGDYAPKFIRIDDDLVKDPLVAYILARPAEHRVADIADVMVKLIDDMWPIPEQEIRRYVARVVESLSSAQLQDFLSRKWEYSRKLKQKIRQLAEDHAEERFRRMLAAEQIMLREDYVLPPIIVPGRPGADIAGSLYEREGEMNGFEVSVITALASLPNVAFWHRNPGRGKGFAINGFKSNHYPDFIIHTQKGKTILLETKGDDRDNSDSAAKLRLGKAWADKAGSRYRYFMVFGQARPEGAFSVDEIRDVIRQL